MRVREANVRPIPNVQRVFVTGAAGFIGSHLVERLLQQNYQVVGYDDFSAGHKLFLKPVWLHQNFTMVQGDVQDTNLLASAMTGSDLVFHLAGNSSSQLDIHHPTRDLNHNTIGTLNVLQAMVATAVSRLLYVSSSAVYGSHPTEPVTESTPFPKVDSLYGASKLSAEGAIHTYAKNYQLQATILRPASVLGPRSVHNLVGDIYRLLVLNPDELQVPLPGAQRYSFVHVIDFVDAAIHVLRRHATQSNSAEVEIFNVGLTEVSRISDVIRCVCRQQGLVPAIKMATGEAPNEYLEQALQLDTTRLQRAGWIPYSSAQDSIYESVQWLRDNHWALGDPYDKMPAPINKVQTPRAAPITPIPAPAVAPTPRKRSLLRDLLPGSN